MDARRLAGALALIALACGTGTITGPGGSTGGPPPILKELHGCHERGWTLSIRRQLCRLLQRLVKIERTFGQLVEGVFNAQDAAQR